MAVVHNYLPGDPLLIDKIVYELKSQGIFDQFRKECIADVDTKPAYQNLRQRVEGSVSGFLSTQKWSSDMNKNQVREMLRKNIHESGFLETGVERIVDQVVNPKINSIFLPKVTEIVYKFLGINQPTNEQKENLKLTFSNDDLLPTDLEAVSPESEKKFDIGNSFQNLDDSKLDEDESPPFEPLEEKPIYIPPEENSVDSHLSGISGLVSHDSNHSQEFSKPIQMEISNQDSALSKQSSEGRLSIVMSDDNDTKMEICEDSNQKTPKLNETKLKDFDFNPESLNNNTTPKKTESKPEEKSKSERSSKSHDKHKSRHDSKSDKKDDKRSDKDRKERRDKHSSRDKGRDKDRKDSKSSNSKSEKDSKSDSKNDKDKSKSSNSSSSNRHSSSSRDKDKSSSSKKESSSSSKERGDNKDKSKSNSSTTKDKDSKHKDSKSKGDSKSSSKHDSKSDKHKKDDKHKSDRHSSSSKSRDKDKKDSKKDKKENKDDHFSSKKKSDRRSTDRDSNDGQSGLKSSSSSFDSTVSSQNQNKSQESSNSNSNNGSGDSGNSDAIEGYTYNNAPITILNDKLEKLNEVTINTYEGHVEVPTFKLIKPKFASNIHEAKRLMKIRKQLSLLEKQSYIDVSRVLCNKVNENNKLKTKSDKVKKKSKNETKQPRDNHATKVNKNLKKTPTVKEVKASTPQPLSPPLKSSVVSAATWDALEAKLHQSINYSTCYDVVDTLEETEIIPVYNKDDCLYLELDVTGRTQRYLKYVNEYIRNLQDTVEKHLDDQMDSKPKPRQVQNHVNSVNKSVKRKFADYHSDVKNNNKKFNTHHIEVHENFSLPLSPAESDNSLDKKSDTSESSYKSSKKTETEFIDKVKKSVRGSAKTQRYSSEDLYKPRPIFGGSRRRNGRKLGID